MAYLNLDLDYFDHPKTKRMVATLGKNSEMFPIRLWCHAGKYRARDGKLSGYSILELEAIVEWRGPKGKAIEALVSVGFLEKTEDGFKIHDWKAINGHIHALKSRNKKVALSRWSKLSHDGSKNQSTVDTRNIPVVYQKHTTGVPQPLPAIPAIPAKEKERDPARARSPSIKEFSPPAAHEVKLYGELIGYKINAEDFITHYQAQGWKRGNNVPIEDWKALVIQWKTRDQEGGPNGNNRGRYQGGGQNGGHVAGYAAPVSGEPRIVD